MMVLEDFIYLITDAHNFDDTAKKQFSTQKSDRAKNTGDIRPFLVLFRTTIGTSTITRESFSHVSQKLWFF
jgi:hypothetical protein